MNLRRVVTGYVQRTDVEKIARLEDDAEELTKRLAKDVELFDEGRVVLCRLEKTHVESLYKSA